MSSLYPLGYFGIAFVNTLFSQWIVYFSGPGGDAAGALLLGYLVQAAVSPLVGWLSDCLAGYGFSRRMPVLLASPLLALVFFGIWGRGGIGLGTLIPAYCVLFVSVAQPYVALLGEVTQEDGGRTRMGIVGASFALVATAVAAISAPAVIERFSFEGLGLIGGGVLLGSVFAPTALLRVRGADRRPDSKAWSAAWEALSDPLCRNFFLGNGLLTVFLASLTILVPFINESLLSRPKSDLAILNGFLFLGIAIALAGAARVRAFQRFPLVRIAQVSGGLGAAIPCLLLGLEALLGRQWLPLWWAGFALSGFVILSSLVVPALEITRMTDGNLRDRRGVYFGLNGVAINLANAAAFSVVPLLLAPGSSWSMAARVRACLAFAAAAALGSAFCYGRSLAQSVLRKTA